MAFTITAGVGVAEVVAGSKYSIDTVEQREIILVVNYTIGDETSLDIAFTQNFPALSNLETEISERDTADIMQQLGVKLTETKKATIPVSVPKNVDKIYLNISNTGGTPTGSMTLYSVPNSEVY